MRSGVPIRVVDRHSVLARREGKECKRSISGAGLRRALPRNIDLILDPGRPVRVCSEEDVHAAIRLALRKNVILVAPGNMLGVPANVPKNEPRSLEQPRAVGGEVQPIASRREGAKIAEANPARAVVCFAADFEANATSR